MQVNNSVDFNYLFNYIKNQHFNEGASFSEYLQKNAKFDDIDANLKTAKKSINNISKSFADDLADFDALKFNAKLESMKMALKEANALDSEVNLQDDDLLSDKFAQLKKQSQKDAQMFKTFDFMQIMNKLIYGNNTEKEQQELLNKAMKIANSI